MPLTDDDYSADTTTWTSVKWDDVEAGLKHIYFAIVRFPQLAISHDSRLNGAGEGMVTYYPDYNNTSSMWVDLLDDTARNTKASPRGEVTFSQNKKSCHTIRCDNLFYTI